MEIIKPISNRVIASCLLTIAGCIVLIWMSNTVAAQSSTQLTLEISTSQPKYLQREPIPLNFKLSNQTSVPIKWNGFFKVGGPNINLVTRLQNGSEIRWNGKDYEVETPTVDNEVTQPNKNKEEENLIDENIAEKLFPLLGRYEFRVEFVYISAQHDQLQTETIVSNQIIIDIDEPRGNDRKAYDYLKNIYDPIDESGNINEIMRSRQYFVDNFPNSVYWKYVTYKLATTYFSFGEHEKAECEFLKISEIDFYHSKQIEKQFQVLSRKLGRDKRNPARQPSVFPNAPIARPVPVPSIAPVPFPNNPPVLIPIPNPNPNKKP